MADASVHKQAGNDAFKKGEYKEAVEEYSKAIELDVENHVLYSNRSGAYVKLKKHKEALADAEDCIRLNRTWAKGYSRKACALFEARRYKDAKSSYEKAAEYEEDAAKKAGYEKDAKDCETRAKSSSGGSMDVLHVALNSAVVYLAVASFLPTSFSGWAFSMSLKLSLLTCLVSIFSAIGRPKFNQEYMRLVLMQPAANRFMAAMVFIMARPFILGVAPQIIHSGIWLAHWSQKRLPSLNPTLWQMGEPYIRKLTSATNEATDMIGFLEVVTGFVLIFELVTPYRNLIVLFLHWQMLRMRYMLQVLNPYGTKETITAFTNLRLKLDNIFLQSSWCPGIVGRFYSWIVKYVSSMVDPEAQKAQQDSMKNMMPSKCTIM